MKLGRETYFKILLDCLCMSAVLHQSINEMNSEGTDIRIKWTKETFFSLIKECPTVLEVFLFEKKQYTILCRPSQTTNV